LTVFDFCFIYDGRYYTVRIIENPVKKQSDLENDFLFFDTNEKNYYFDGKTSFYNKLYVHVEHDATSLVRMWNCVRWILFILNLFLRL